MFVQNLQNNLNIGQLPICSMYDSRFGETVSQQVRNHTRPEHECRCATAVSSVNKSSQSLQKNVRCLHSDMCLSIADFSVSNLHAEYGHFRSSLGQSCRTKLRNFIFSSHCGQLTKILSSENRFLTISKIGFGSRITLRSSDLHSGQNSHLGWQFRQITCLHFENAYIRANLNGSVQTGQLCEVGNSNSSPISLARCEITIIKNSIF